MDAKPDRRVPVAELAAFIERVLVAVDVSEEDARKVGELMARADLLGCDGHGVFRLPATVKRIREGGINLRPNIRIARERGAMAVVDGDNAIGHLVMRRATEIAIAKAKEQGTAWVGARMSNHAGPAQLYPRLVLEHDMIGMYGAVGSANHLPPWGGTEMLLSTNPIAIAVPSGNRPPIVLDMATTVAAYGKVKTKAFLGEQMPEGWMIDRQGKPLTDPNRADEGFLLPIGGAKGYGLALMLGILAGSLNAAAFGRDVVDFNADFKSTTNTGHFITAIDLAAFGEPADFKARMDHVWEEMKSSPTLPGFDEVRLPGERTDTVRADRAAHGVPLYPELAQALARTARDVGIDPL